MLPRASFLLGFIKSKTRTDYYHRNLLSGDPKTVLKSVFKRSLSGHSPTTLYITTVCSLQSGDTSGVRMVQLLLALFSPDIALGRLILSPAI